MEAAFRACNETRRLAEEKQKRQPLPDRAGVSLLNRRQNPGDAGHVPPAIRPTPADAQGPVADAAAGGTGGTGSPDPPLPPLANGGEPARRNPTTCAQPQLAPSACILPHSPAASV